MIDSFVNKLKRLGIEVELVGNYPWIYLDKVNGDKVVGKQNANHGFCAFIVPVSEGVTRWSNRRKVFNKIREML